MFYLRLMTASLWGDMLLDRESSVETTFYRSQVLQGLQKELLKHPDSMATLLVMSNLAIGAVRSPLIEPT
jgi:hypothetical protein